MDDQAPSNAVPDTVGPVLDTGVMDTAVDPALPADNDGIEVEAYEKNDASNNSGADDSGEDGESDVADEDNSPKVPLQSAPLPVSDPKPVKASVPKAKGKPRKAKAKKEDQAPIPADPRRVHPSASNAGPLNPGAEKRNNMKVDPRRHPR